MLHHVKDLMRQNRDIFWAWAAFYLAAQTLKRFRERSKPGRIEDADDLSARAGGITKGSQEIKNGPRAQFFADRHGILHARMKRRRIERSQADLLEAFFNAFWV